MSGGAGGKSFGGPQIGGGPAPIQQQPQQPDIYQRYGGQPNVDSDPNTAGYQSPGTTPAPQPPQVQQPSTGGKGGFQIGYQEPGLNIPRPDIGGGVSIGGGPAQLDPNAPNALGPEGQQPMMPQQNATQGGKSGFGAQPQITQQQFEDFASRFFK